MINVLLGIIVLLVSLPLTSQSRFLFGHVNLLPFQACLAVGITAILFQMNRRSDVLTAMGLFLGLIIVLFLNTFLNRGHLTDMLMNTLVVYLMLLAIFSPQWPARLATTINLPRILFWAYVIFIVIDIFLLIDFMRTKGWHYRFPGIGSSSVHSLFSAYGVVFFIRMAQAKEIKTITASSYSAVLVVTVLATQTRGVFLTLLAICFLVFSNRLRRLNYFHIFFPIALLLIVFEPLMNLILSLPVVQRLNPTEYGSLDRFTSGRLDTQMFIGEWFASATSWRTLLFGKGLNAIKSLPSLGLEYPHFDLLYVLYEGGISLVVVYLLLSSSSILMSRDYLYPLVLFLTGFHTNIVTAPNLIFLVYLLSMNSRILSLKEDLLETMTYYPGHLQDSHGT